ncbi:uncharacterized protein LOC116252337 [Nymphaea colorata]|nr:uncharacterized protein LOC116252337 [Nymphaea colorata]
MADEITTIVMDNAAGTSHGGSGDGGGSRKCIFKWPQDLVSRLGEDIPREPQVVAIGPYHHRQENLMNKEYYKRKALSRVLRLSGGLGESKFVVALKEVEQELRDHYDELDAKIWPSDSFVVMMLLDGCFLLDFLFKLDKLVDKPLTESLRTQLLYTPAYALLIRDIHLLENQIPGLVLEVLMKVAGGSQNPLSGGKLSSQALHLLNLQRMSLLGENLFPRPPRSISARARRAVEHFFCRAPVSLHILRSWGCDVTNGCSAPHPGDDNEGVQQTNVLEVIALEENLQGVALETLWTITRSYKHLRSAKTLRTSGVTFKKSKPETGVSGVRFDKGVLYLPELVLNQASQGVFMNMVAFERMQPQNRGITSFMSFMDSLIDTAEDVRILGKAGIVTNKLGSDEEAANIFNKLGVLQMCSPFDKVLEEVQNYASLPHHGWWGHFKDTYLANPWTILSLTGALYLLLLATVQTTYTVLSYYHTNRSGK